MPYKPLLWTKEDLALLRANADIPNRELRTLFPGRSPNAIDFQRYAMGFGTRRPPAVRKTDWPEAKKQQLRAEWDAGTPSAEIGRRLGGMSKNSVVGMARRMGLAGRPSPIQRDGAPPAPRRPKPPKLQDLVPAPSSQWTDARIADLRRYNAAGLSIRQTGERMDLTPWHVAHKGRELGLAWKGRGGPRRVATDAVRVDVAPLVVALVSLPVRQVVAAPVPLSNSRPRQCCWLDGERRAYIQCEGVTVAGSVYCGPHHRRAYVRVGNRVAEAFVPGGAVVVQSVRAGAG